MHDLAVLPAYRSRGVGRRLLEQVEIEAQALGCCKITLEVKDDNHRAQNLYRALGFELGAPDGPVGRMWFVQKRLGSLEA